MDIDNFSIGTDIEEIKRFRGKTLEGDRKFLEYIFTQKEIEYCFSKARPESHLAARFCAKEAAVKALFGLGIEHIVYKQIEITNKQNGKPELTIENYPDIKAKVSISHSKTDALATVVLIKS